MTLRPVALLALALSAPLAFGEPTAAEPVAPSAEAGSSTAAPAVTPTSPEAPPAPVAPEAAVEAEAEAKVESAPPSVAPLTDAERIAALEARLAEQQAAMEVLNAGLTKTRLKLLETPDLSVELQGDYRVRGYAFNHLYASQTAANGDYRDARVMRHRLRIRPVIAYKKDLAKLAIEVRGLEDVVWGDNDGVASVPLLGLNTSNTGFDGQEAALARISRVWVETKLPVGVLRVGRQPSDWGMGLLANDGDGYDDSFGENYGGTTSDRVLFATNPIAIAQKIMGLPGKAPPLIAAIAVDRVSEDPLTQFYGYECTAGLDQSSSRYDARCDVDGDGRTDVTHGFDEERQSSQRNSEWWVDQNDDVLEMVYVLAYKGEDIDYLGGTGDLTAGLYAVTRSQRETDSTATIIDGHLKARVHHVYVEGEGLWIGAKTRALTLPDYSQDEDPLSKKASIFGYVTRLGYERDAWTVVMEHGYAAGDENPSDAKFTGRALSSDYNVGLLLYEEVLATVTRQIWTDTARGLWSQGGVYNSRYLFPTATLSPMESLQFIGGFLIAWPDKADGAVIRCRSSDKSGCASPPGSQATASTLGWEVDLGVKHVFHEHLHVAVEAGFAKTTDRVPLSAAGLDPKGQFFTLQSRFGWQF